MWTCSVSLAVKGAILSNSGREFNSHTEHQKSTGQWPYRFESGREHHFYRKEETMELKEIIVMLLLATACYVSYRFGYTMADNKWKAEYEERISELVVQKLDEIKGLYEETYRNVFRSLLGVYKEVEEEKENKKI